MIAGSLSSSPLSPAACPLSISPNTHLHWREWEVTALRPASVHTKGVPVLVSPQEGFTRLLTLTAAGREQGGLGGGMFGFIW